MVKSDKHDRKEDIAHYRYATAFEALLGYQYIVNEARFWEILGYIEYGILLSQAENDENITSFRMEYVFDDNSILS